MSNDSDYSMFVGPYLSNIEMLRAYLMQPPNPNQSGHSKIGLNPAYGLIQGDYVCGGYQSLGSSLNNNDLMAAKGLDYLNSLKGINSTIEANTRMYLAMRWNNTQPPGWACTAIMAQSTWTYTCTDKHELLFGTASPCYQTIITSCATSNGGEAFITSYQGVQMVVESGVGGSCLSSGGALNNLAPYINFLWLKGDPASILLAKQIFDQTLTNWTPTSATGIGGTIGGCFSSPYGPNPAGGAVARTRDLGFWLNMARATGLWNSSSLALNVTQEVVNQIWAQQKPDGSIAVDYPNTDPAPCGGTSSTYPKDSGESDGLTIAAFDSRVPQWFAQGPISLASSFSFSPTSPGANQLMRFTASTIGGSSPYTYSWNFGDTTTATGSTVTHTYSATGTYTVALTTTDATHASYTSSKPVTVSSVNSSQPSFTIAASPSSLAVTAGSSNSSTLTLTSLNGFSGTLSLSPLGTPGIVASLSRKSVSLSSGGSKTLMATVNTTSSLPPGSYTMNVTGVSGTVSNSITLILTVRAPSIAATSLPILTLPVSETVAAGATLRFTVTATDQNPNRILTLSATNLPTGSSFDPATGAFTWTPAVTQSGSYRINFTATDNGTPPMSQTKTVNVQVSPASGGSSGSCPYCSIMRSLPAALWLLILGGLLGLTMTLVVLYHKARHQLKHGQTSRPTSQSHGRIEREIE